MARRKGLLDLLRERVATGPQAFKDEQGATPDEFYRHAQAALQVVDTDVAFDGSRRLPRRYLSAGERDVLVRIISDIVTTARTNPDLLVKVVRINVGDIMLLQIIREAIDPRES